MSEAHPLAVGDRVVHKTFPPVSRHKLALFSGILVLLIYVVVVLGEFLAPYDPGDYIARYTYAPPQPLHLFDTSNGQFSFSPYAYTFDRVWDVTRPPA